MAIHTLSDYNSPYSRASSVAKRETYSDLPLTLVIHPNTRDIVPLSDLDAIKQSVKNLVLTNFGERLFRPDAGGNVTSLLFENVSMFTEIVIRDEIKKVLASYEPRIRDLTVQVNATSDELGYNITIGFKVVGNVTENIIEFILNRLR